MRYTVIGLALLLLGSGCASYEPTAMPAPKVQPADWHVEDDLAVAVYPLVEEVQQQQVLSANFNQAGVIPLQVVAENRTDRMLLVRPFDLVLTLPDRRTVGPTASASVANMVDEEGSVVGPAIAFGLIGYMVASNAEESAKQARMADYESKSFRSKRLAKNQSTHGFVFFVPPPGSGTFDEATLSVFFVDEEAARTEKVDVPLTQLGFIPAEDRKKERQKETPEYPE